MGKGRTPCCEKGRVKKGPWSQDEDLKLISFIHRHGHSNWRSLPKLAGLARCGKSCRLRWVNYLRPDVRRGSLTPDEEDTIIRLQSLIGNKWSKIASHLPGRTDNEIKNIWNTHLKRRVLIDQNSNRKAVSNINVQGLTTSIISPKDDGTFELSSSDCTTTRGSKHDIIIDVTREISYEEPNSLVDLWESLLLDSGCTQLLNPNNIHDSVLSKVDTSVNNNRLANSLCPLESFNNFELNRAGPSYGGYPEIVDDQITNVYQLEAISNDGFFKMDNSIDSYLEIMACPSSPTYSTFSGF